MSDKPGLLYDVLYLDGPNAVGKTYTIDTVKNNLLGLYPNLKVECVNIKMFSDDLDPDLIAKIRSYDIQCFNDTEITSILAKHKQMLLYVNSRVNSKEVDLVIVDRSIISFLIYNTMYSKSLYNGLTLPHELEYNTGNVCRYIYREIMPLIDMHNSLYVYLRFSLDTSSDYITQSLATAMLRLSKRGVVDYNTTKLSNIIFYMEYYHLNMIESEDKRYFSISPSANVRAYFKNCIATDSANSMCILDKLIRG